MTVATRKRRGRDTERILAEYLRPLWPHATANAPGAPGPGVLHTPGVALECKARRGLDLPAWLRQARRNASTELPVLVIRGDGQGPATVGEWAAVLPLDTLLELLHREPQRQRGPEAAASEPRPIQTAVTSTADPHRRTSRNVTPTPGPRL